MHAVVVFESLWGNTREIAEAIADGLGPGARAGSTADLTPEDASQVDLLVAGAPVQAFSLPTGRIRDGIRPELGHPQPDLTAPTLRSWLERLPEGRARVAAFDTKLRWSPGSAAGVIDAELVKAGYQPIARPEHFIVTGKYGPLRAGEVDRARHWGQELATTMREVLVAAS